jgi:two-component system nitrogen regulation response regulator NtrX
LPFKLGDEVLAALQGYEWPGNVRQMHNVIETMLILAPNERNEPVDLNLLPAEIHQVVRSGNDSEMDTLMGLPLRGAREEFERAYLVTQLHRFDGNISRAASFIGMERSALHRKLKALDIASDNQDGGRSE